MYRFSKKIIDWYKENKRDLPWRHTKDPYYIWISEIILQQTRVDQGISYYYKFIKYFPTLRDLAFASEEEVLKLWQGLGYYSRARNLHYTSKYIINNYDGKFPDNYSDILQLRGIGPYTAAAISSIAFGLPYAVVDGNVIRVLSRIFNIDTPYDTTDGKKVFSQKAQKLIFKADPSSYNQALMEFGSLQCKPKRPNCTACIFKNNCIANSQNKIDVLPVKIKNLKQKKRYLHFLVIKQKESIFFQKRKKGIWKGLYEFPLIELSEKKNDDDVFNLIKNYEMFESKKISFSKVSKEYIHLLSHQKIYAKFWMIESEDLIISKYNLVLQSDLLNYPVSRLIEKYLHTTKLH